MQSDRATFNSHVYARSLLLRREHLRALTIGALITQTERPSSLYFRGIDIHPRSFEKRRSQKFG